MNRLEEAVIPLAGPGLVSKSSDSYAEGEYKELTNMIITPEGTLKKRPPVQGLFGPGSETPSAQKIIGTWGSDMVYANYDYPTNLTAVGRSRRVYGSGEGTYADGIGITNWAALKADIDAKTGFTTDKRYYIEGVLQYNNQSFWLIIATQRTVAVPNYTYHYRSFVVPSNYNFANPNENVAVTFGTAQAVETAAYTEVYSTANWNVVPQIPVTGFFISRDRCYVVMRDTVFFSKPTDPTKWLVADDGGFLRFPGKLIKKTVAVVDSIYVIFDTSISVINYNTSPNKDAQVKIISDGVGGEDAVLYGDTVYVLSYKHVVTINGNNVQKVMDLGNFFRSTIGYVNSTGPAVLSAGASPSLKLEAWGDGLYMYLRKIKFASLDQSIYHVHPVAFGDMFRLDLGNGSISKYTFGYSGQDYKIADSISTRSGVRLSSDRMYMMHKNEASTQYDVFYFNSNLTFCPFPAGTIAVDNYGVDAYSHENNTHQWCCVIPIKIVLAEFSPDKLKYLYRKFRSVSVQADLPYLTVANERIAPEWTIRVQAGTPKTWGGSPPFSTPSGADAVFLAEPIGEGGEPTQDILTYRHGINQRAKAVTLTIETPDAIKGISFNSHTELNALPDAAEVLAATCGEIVDLSLMWSETRRGPTNSSSERA